ncbi:hypothetical protein CKAH01_00369 [Colletotrichum kahawae]|uniref:Uncharacterized protein n=1 Tax=Colletotrichum kahawae TaxID=34407 RepID=A0AAD9YV03_COLKA|nr:hypothetical protein CKAH01_00369 [Colletotrichum kahawae]
MPRIKTRRRPGLVIPTLPPKKQLPNNENTSGLWRGFGKWAYLTKGTLTMEGHARAARKKSTVTETDVSGRQDGFKEALARAAVASSSSSSSSSSSNGWTSPATLASGYQVFQCLCCINGLHKLAYSYRAAKLRNKVRIIDFLNTAIFHHCPSQHSQMSNIEHDQRCYSSHRACPYGALTLV